MIFMQGLIIAGAYQARLSVLQLLGSLNIWFGDTLKIHIKLKLIKYVNFTNLLCFINGIFFFMNSTILEYQSKCYFASLQMQTISCLFFFKLYKMLHFSIQNCDLKFTVWIKLIHLCAVKNEFGNLGLFREGKGPKIIRIPRASDQVNLAQYLRC